ncbi:hypothetical protein ACE38V_12775 [Cytobacillus sp. Hz8]|uniref:hypothetical protein n=1 Tax=Cytobacillus sp. Hz8 TaxID=3347168 RepID=UPI0035DA8A33
MKLFKSLTTSEKRKIREAVIPELEQYRILRSLENINDAQETFLRRMEKALEGLPSIEKLVITKRYTDNDSDYVTDYQMYNIYMNPPVCVVTYSSIRDRAMFKIALFLEIDTGIDLKVC